MTKVILQERVESLGNPGDLVRVSDGYARNFLLPRKLAYVANERNVKELEHQKKLAQHRLDRLLKESRSLAEKIESVSCSISRKSGEEDKLFGSVTSKDIQEALAKEGVEVERKQIQLAEPIKILGVFTVPVKIHEDVTANLKLWVVKED